MLYLLQSFTSTSPVLKIGYAESWEEREKAYRTHNPGFSVLHLLSSGSTLLESRLHSYFSPLLLQLPGQREWMAFDSRIPPFFPFLEGLEGVAEGLRDFGEEELQMHGLKSGTVLTSLIDSLFRFSASGPLPSIEALFEDRLTATQDLISLSLAPPFSLDPVGLEKENWGKVWTVLGPSGRGLDPSPYLLRVDLVALSLLGQISREEIEPLYMKWKQYLIK